MFIETYIMTFACHRYLGALKRYVRTRSRPEGAIAEAHITYECLTWCSLHLDDFETAFNKPERNVDITEDGGVDIFRHRIGLISAPVFNTLTQDEVEAAHWFIITNCSAMIPYIE